MPASKAHQAETAARRAELIRLRRQGVPFDDERIVDAPATVEVSGPGGGAVRLDHVGLAELNKLIATAGDPDSDEADDEDDELRYVDEDEETDDDGDAA